MLKRLFKIKKLIPVVSALLIATCFCSSNAVYAMDEPKSSESNKKSGKQKNKNDKVEDSENDEEEDSENDEEEDSENDEEEDSESDEEEGEFLKAFGIHFKEFILPESIIYNVYLKYLKEYHQYKVPRELLEATHIKEYKEILEKSLASPNTNISSFIGEDKCIKLLKMLDGNKNYDIKSLKPGDISSIFTKDKVEEFIGKLKDMLVKKCKYIRSFVDKKELLSFKAQTIKLFGGFTKDRIRDIVKDNKEVESRSVGVKPADFEKILEVIVSEFTSILSDCELNIIANVGEYKELNADMLEVIINNAIDGSITKCNEKALFEIGNNMGAPNISFEKKVKFIVLFEVKKILESIKNFRIDFDEKNLNILKNLIS